METLCLLNTNSPFLSPHRACLSKFDYSRDLVSVESQYLSFCVWFISQGMMSSGFIHVV